MMKKIGKLLFIVIVLLCGCSKSSPDSDMDAQVNTAPKGSRFAKITPGMSDTQVRDILGQPNDTNFYMTGKAWIPFYFGPDTSRQTYFYKGQGRIAISSRGKVIKAVYDPSEDGYK